MPGYNDPVARSRLVSSAALVELHASTYARHVHPVRWLRHSKELEREEAWTRACRQETVTPEMER